MHMLEYVRNHIGSQTQVVMVQYGGGGPVTSSDSFSALAKIVTVVGSILLVSLGVVGGRSAVH